MQRSEVRGRARAIFAARFDRDETKDSLKIVILASYAPSLVNFRGELIRRMVEGGHSVFACAPVDDAECPNKVAALGATFCPVPLRRTGMNPLTDLVYGLAVAGLMRRIRPDAVFSYTAKPVIYGNLAAGFTRTKNSFTLISGLGTAFGDQGGFKRKLLHSIVTRLYRASLRHSKIVFFQNRDDRDQFVREGLVDSSRTRLVAGSGVDLRQFSAASPNDGEPYFLMLARLIPEKGVLEFVEAARCVRRSHPNARFLLGGPFESGSHGLKREQVMEWNREGVVEYLGELRCVRPALAACRCFVLPSYYREGIPRSILEAMAVGRPVVTTDSPGCRETILEPSPPDTHGIRQGRNGFLVPPRSVEPLVAAFRRLIEEKTLAIRMGAESRAFAEEKFDVHKVNRQMLEEMNIDVVRNGVC